MVNYLADTNIFIRIFVQDNPEQTKIAQKYLEQAREKLIKISVLSEIITEIEYVLTKVYKIEKKEVVDKLLLIVEATYLKVERRKEWVSAINIYSKYNVDLIDAFLYVLGNKKKYNILSFDKDFKKIKN